MLVSQQFRAELKVYEGFANHLYRDINGHVTVGYGHLLKTVGAATGLSFQIKEAAHPAPPPSPQAFLTSLRVTPLLREPTFQLPRTRAATQAEIKTDWNAVMAQPFGKKYAAGYYQKFTKTFLTLAFCETLFDHDIEAKIAEVRAKFDAFDTFPQPAQEAILDMAFNLGVSKLYTIFQNLREAILAENWSKAAGKCHRRDLDEARNEATRQRFLEAAKIATATAAALVLTQHTRDR